VLLEAIGFAFLAAINPTALLIGAAYLGSANPRTTVVFYLAGAIIMTAALGVIFLVAIRAGGLSQVGHRTPRYGLRLGLGVAALAGAAVVASRKPKAAPAPADGADRKQGWMARLISRPSPLTAVAVGILVFYPSAGLVAAVQAIGTSHDSVGLEAVGVALVVLVDVLTIWAPLLVYLIAPEATTRTLRAFDDWLRRRKRTITIVGLTAVGLILIVNGSLGLAG
jgi:Sap, sulfolipid-1-addressing protein